MPLKIRKAGTTYNIPLYTSKTAGNSVNGTKFITVRRAGQTCYVHMYPVDSKYALYPLKMRIGGQTYQAGPAYDSGIYTLQRIAAGIGDYTIPANAIDVTITSFTLIGAGGAGAGQGANYTYTPPTGNSFTYYGGGGGGGGAGAIAFPTPPTNIQAGHLFRLNAGTGGKLGVSGGGQSYLWRYIKPNWSAIATVNGGQNGTAGGNATYGSHGSGGAGGLGGNAGGGGTGGYGANGTSAGKGANGAGGAISGYGNYGRGGTATGSTAQNGYDGYGAVTFSFKTIKTGI